MLKKELKLGLIIAVCFLLHMNVLPYCSFLSLNGVMPDLLAIVVVFYAQYVKRNSLLVFAAGVGIVRDVFSSDVFGVQIAASVVAAFCVYYFIKKFHHEQVPYRALYVAYYMSVFFVVVIAIKVLSVFSVAHSGGYLSVACSSVVITTIVSVPVLMALHALMKNSLRQYQLF